MNKAQLVDKMAQRLKCTKAEAGRMVDAWIEIVSKEMARSEVRLAGFGTFTTVKRAARKGINPQTGQAINIPARRVPKFRPAKELRNCVR